ncbi:hypothetical protein RJ640_004226 [Escallonia rubra]|uniref:D-aminoacyl-tRNA deacylase n=1 Tax=Escallonia rubra TaxID=112253 RepID=A0AA88U457_9ASTE|nr:hypothetical protein RJ640_004226 [Escallonia rubra]
MPSFVNREVRLLKHDNSIVKEDHLDKRWEAATGEVVDEVIFLGKHTAISNRPALTVHPIGVPHLREDEVSPAGGKPGWAAPPNPRIGPWLRLLKTIAESHNLLPEFEVTHVLSCIVYANVTTSRQAEGLHHDTIAILTLIPFRHRVSSIKYGIWVGHLISGYSLPMEDPGQSKAQGDIKGVGGTWKQAIKVAFETTSAAFPRGEVLAHLDNKSIDLDIVDELLKIN